MTAQTSSAKAARSEKTPATPEVDTGYLETLIGYNARRAALAVIEVFMVRMEPYDVRPVDFSVLCVIAHNDGITSRQLCSALGILPPNLVGMLNQFEKRGLVHRQPHPSDGRAMGLHISAAGSKLLRAAEGTASGLEDDVASRLSESERKTLIRLLKKIYL